MNADERRAYAIASERDDNTCQRCLRYGVVQRDHRKERSRGGRTTPANLQLLCPTCHLWKTDHARDAKETGYGCPGSADPTEYPARRWVTADGGMLRRAWVLYDDVGGWVEISEERARALIDGEVVGGDPELGEGAVDLAAPLHEIVDREAECLVGELEVGVAFDGVDPGAREGGFVGSELAAGVGDQGDVHGLSAHGSSVPRGAV